MDFEIDDPARGHTDNWIHNPDPDVLPDHVCLSVAGLSLLHGKNQKA
jgi:hypothetical protein